MLDRRVKGQPLRTDDAELAALCQGAFNGIIAVNYITPPYLPFCEQDSDKPIDYVRVFLAFMKANPSFATKHFGLVVLVALARVRPRSDCESKR